MLDNIKNFTIDKVLRHVAENRTLNGATNVLALVPVAILTALHGGADWSLMLQCCSKPGSFQEIVRVTGLVAVAVLLWFCGKAPWLKQWLPVVEDIVAEAQREALAHPPTTGKIFSGDISDSSIVNMKMGVFDVTPVTDKNRKK